MGVLVDYQHYQSEFQITANDCVIQPLMLPLTPTQPRTLHIPASCVHVSVPEPASAARDEQEKKVGVGVGSLTVACRSRTGLGGSGPTCQLSQAWLELA